MKLGESYLSQSSWCMGTSLCSLCVASGFSARAGHEVNRGHVFSWGALAAGFLVGSRAGVGVARVSCKLGLLLVQWWLLPSGGASPGPKGVEQEP